MESPEFTLATLTPSKPARGTLGATGSSQTGDAPTPYLPRVRTCVYRGMFAELPENKHNKARMNSKVFESDLPTFTTDVRMAKVAELFSSSKGHGDPSQSQGSGGGGPVEAVFWVKDTMTQWRIKGSAFIVAEDIEGDGQQSSGCLTVKAAVGARMRIDPKMEEEKSNWSWQTELTAHFGNLSPGMRGSFKNPPPGTPVSIPVGDKNLSLGQKIDDLHDEIARRNFRLVIITPDEVEQVDLTDPAKARRWRYTYVGPEGEEGKTGQSGDLDGEWKKEELWP